VARMGEERKAYRFLVRKPEGKTPLGRSRRRWVDGIRMDLKEIGWGSVEWIQLAQDRGRWRALVNTGSGATELANSRVGLSKCGKTYSLLAPSIR
jgi:hypothetical protein